MGLMTSGTSRSHFNRLQATFRGSLGAFTLDVDFTAPPQGVTALFGPSGCGKTTILRCMAGLERLQDAHFSFGPDAVWQDDSFFVPPHKRDVGYIFQDANLFPHLTVRKNLLYGQKRSTSQSGDTIIAFDDVVDLLGIGKLLDRLPARLSGGERQRVGIGRALLSQPRLLLLDEPLSALDSDNKREILPYLERLPAILTIPMIYVSHDIREVRRLAEHVIILKEGRIVQAGAINDCLPSQSHHAQHLECDLSFCCTCGQPIHD